MTYPTEEMMSPPQTAGRVLVDSLRLHGVDRAFCVPGESYLEVLDALHDAAQDILQVEGGESERQARTSRRSRQVGFPSTRSSLCTQCNTLAEVHACPNR
jgi:hypothetical protein